jgi:SlyX protein
MTGDERITELEIRVAEQERAIEELSDALTAQWRTIEELRGRLKRLSERLEAVEETAEGETPAARPPHY